ncbi:kelch-like protein 12 [Oculina patagonica]
MAACVKESFEEENAKEHGVDFEDFKDELLHKLNELRETNILCDTTIRAQGQDFPAHKCVLSAASPYFRAMFTSELKEKESNVVELQEAKSTTISGVLQYIYTGEANIDSSNAQDLVMIADYLIIPSLKAKASLFLKGTLDASNCLALESFASQYNCEPLKQAAVALKFENFVAVAKSEDFRMLDSKKVKELICMDEINVSEEEEVYEAVIAWVKRDLPSRECLLPELLKCIRLFSMSKYSLRNILDEELVKKSLACTRVILDTLDVFLFPDRFQEISLKPRLSLDEYEQVVVLTGGLCKSSSKKDTQGFVPSTRTWVSLPLMPFPCSHHSAAVCGGLLYVLGGKNSAPMCCFNPKQNKWSSHGQTLCLKDCSVISFHEELYVIGGEGSWRDVQIYNPIIDKWRQVASMETCRAGHSAVLLQKHIYVIAGHDGTVCHNSVECYNPLTDQWSKVSNISKPRRSASSAAVTAAEKIVVVGGFGDMTDTTIEPSCEIFESRTNQWNLVSSPTRPRAAGGIVIIDDNIYLFGGENETKLEYAVERFNITSYKWNAIGFTPQTMQASFLQASLLKLPKELIDK